MNQYPMKTNPLKQGAITEHSAGFGTVTRKMVRERAVEIAAINGHPPHDISKSDWEQAKRELTGQPDMDLKEAALEAAPESERWDPVHGSTGGKTEPVPSEDENDEGESDQQVLVNNGVTEAEHDQMRQAIISPGHAAGETEKTNYQG